MRTHLLSLFVGIAPFAAHLVLRAEPSESSRLEKELASLSGEQVLARVQSGTWLKLPALSVVTAEERQSVQRVACMLLKALAQEGRTVPNLTDAASLLDRALRVAAISQIAMSKGGYLNELIATSADQVFLDGAWTILDRSPTLASKLLPAIEARGKLRSPKAWFLERYAIDPDLVARKEILDAMKPDASGFQAVVQLQKKGRDASNLPTVFGQISTPEIALLWWMVYTTDYRMVVLRAGIAYLDGGGKFTENVNDFRAKCVSIFGEGLPFIHELKRGSIYPEDIWDSWNAARNASVRDMQMAQWFGKAQQ